MKHTLLTGLTVVILLGSSSIFARSVGEGIYFDAAVSAQYQRQIDDFLFYNKIDPDISEFKVPATKVTNYICIPVHTAAGTNPCGQTQAQTETICPETVPVMSGGKVHYVPVNCVGPDADGNCECEFR